MKNSLSILLFSLAPLAANAAPIAGKIAVGTWGTQAEFADVRVVKGSTRLYSSNFFTGTAGFSFSGGTWSTANGYLRQTGDGWPALATVGDTSWTDYTLTLKARKISGDEGFLIGFGMPDNTTKSWWNIAGWGNTQQALEAPGFSMLAKSSNVQTGRWYTIKVEVKGSDVRCYLDNVKIYDTMRLLDDAEWGDRNDQILTSGGLATLPGFEQDQVRELLGRNVYHGAAARAKFDSLPGKTTFVTLTAAQQAALVRNVNRNRLTWQWGYINNPNDTYKLGVITDAMDGACMLYNSLGVFDKHETVESDPPEWVPTADAGYGGTIRFGGSWNRRVAIHEMSHTLGTGTYYPAWGDLMVNGAWNGTYANLQVQAFDGPGAQMHGDSQHYWPYGQNYDNEWSPVNEQRTVQIVAAFRRDMGISGVRDTFYSTDVANGTYRLSPRLAPSSAMEVLGSNPANGATVDLRGYTGGLNQQFLLDKQADGTYRIRTALAGNRAVEIPGGWADNGAQVQLWDDNGNAAQRWYLIPTADGWYKIAPANNVWRSMDLWGVSSADGTPVKLWDFWDGFGQQWKLTKLG
jgi:hypothetical protein